MKLKKKVITLVAFAFICIIIFVLLLFLTDRSKTNLDRFYYLIALAIELSLIIIYFIFFQEGYRHNIFQVNNFDIFKSGIWVFTFIFDIFARKANCFYEKIINNYR